MSKIFVLYHKNCTDGTGAKFAAWKKYGDAAVYLPVAYGEPFPELGNDPDTEVYILDFSYSKEIIKGLQAKYKKVVILDHHKTAEAELKELVDENVVFDMNKSGAMLAWEYFHPGIPAPALISHVQDRDLWKFELAETKMVHAGLGLLKGAVGAWEKYSKPAEMYAMGNVSGINRYLPGTPMHELVETGRSILKYEQQHVESAVPKKIKIIDFLGYKVGITNTGYLISEIGEAIYNSKDLNVDFAIMYFIDIHDVVWLSFRSKKGGVDVAEVAKNHFQGGGHASAAGGKTNLEILMHILSGKYRA